MKQSLQTRFSKKKNADTTQVCRYLRSSLEAVKLQPNLRVSPLLIAAAGMQQLLPCMLYITLSHNVDAHM